MSTNSELIVSRARAESQRPWPLCDAAQTRALEATGAAQDAHLMHKAGLALAKLTLALAPHAQTIWIACGPGNNGGDGMEAAAHLKRWGKQAVITLLHDPAHSPADARKAFEAASEAGVSIQHDVPAPFDVCIDALFGIGMRRPMGPDYASWVARMNQSSGLTIAADVPSGLDADTGMVHAEHVRADHTLSLLTLKPGLFTGFGRDACGSIWFNDLSMAAPSNPVAVLQGHAQTPVRLHASHKGSFGDVVVLGGAPGMAGAALLAGRSALHSGAGRVFVCMLDASAMPLDPIQPELMFREPIGFDFSGKTVVAGCGGGSAIGNPLASALQYAHKLVLDADALNALASQPELHPLASNRPPDTTVLTPHPLEAARLLQCCTHEVQTNRLQAAQKLADEWRCSVVLKGSGTVIAAPGVTPWINPTGNARLASPGTGDVLAGCIGAYLAQGLKAPEAARLAVYRHGLAADRWQSTVLNASELCRRI